MGTSQIGRIVIADAYPLERMGIAAMVKRALGCEAVDVASDLATLEQQLSPATSLVILDLTLPGLTSHESIRKLRLACPSAKLVIVSVLCGVETLLSILRNGAHGILMKNLSQNDFITALRSVVRGQIFIPSHLSEAALSLDSQQNIEAQSKRRLSDRQWQVLDLASKGWSNKEIGRRLQITESTVKVHVSAAFRVMGVTNRTGAIAALSGYGQSQGQLQL